MHEITRKRLGDVVKCGSQSNNTHTAQHNAPRRANKVKPTSVRNNMQQQARRTKRGWAGVASVDGRLANSVVRFHRNHL